MKGKNKIALLLTATVLFMALAGMLFVSCPGDDADTQRVTVTFDINGGEGENPPALSLFKGTSGGDRWPADPKKSGNEFLGWFDSADKKFDSATVINDNVTLKAKWEGLPSGADQPPAAEIAALFDTENGFPATLSDAKKIWGMNNPSMTFAFVADPVPMVYCPNLRNSGATENHSCDECTLYVYGSNDTLAFTTGGAPITDDFGVVIQGLRVVSTKDLWNWTDHGILNFVAKNSTNPLFDNPTEKVVTFANDTWAPSAQWRMEGGKPRFYLYWCNAGNNTSVVVSDEGPLGPFYNPGLSAPMVNGSMSGFETVSWLFDPGTLIDSDGNAYMVLGGDGNNANPGNVRRVQMNRDMTSIVGMGPALNLPWHFEATDIWKWKDIYYITYTTNWGNGKPAGLNSIDVAYVMNDAGILESFPTTVNSTPSSPKPNMANQLMPNGAYGDSTNHSSLFDFRGKTYLIYHASSACQAFGMTRLRTAHLVDIVVNEDGTLKPVTMGAIGVSQMLDSEGHGFNPYNVVEAETMAIEGGVYTKGKGNETTASNGISVASIDSGDWLGLYGVDFDIKPEGAKKFNAVVKVPVTAEGEYTGAIEIRLDPQQDGITNPVNSSRLGTGANAQSRIKDGTVVGRVQVKVKDKADEGKWILVSANLDQTVTGKHNLAFVFYSSNGAAIESFRSYANTPANDGRRRDVGFEIDQWWFE